MLELEDGTLLTAKGGNFVGDTAPMPGFVPTRGGEMVQVSHLPAGFHRPRPELALSFHGPPTTASAGQESFLRAGPGGPGWGASFSAS